MKITDRLRPDRELITEIIPSGASVLDLGCGDGSLLHNLVKKGAVGRGVDIDQQNLILCMERGLSVCQYDLDKGLSDFPDSSYDYVVLNQTLQVTGRPEKVMMEMLRIGKYGIVGFPNFGHWRQRTDLLIRGRMPGLAGMEGSSWHDNPDIHPLTVLDFRDFCKKRNIGIVREEHLMLGRWRSSNLSRPFANFLASTGVFVITNGA